MKILTDATISVPVQNPPYWIGWRFHCGNCKSELQLNNANDATSFSKWRFDMWGKCPAKRQWYLKTFCPVCGSPAFLEDNEHP